MAKGVKASTTGLKKAGLKRAGLTMAGLAMAAVQIAGTPAFAHSTKIRVGDGRVASSPKVGYVMSCQQRFNPNAGGAQSSGDWIKGNYWYPDLKPVVDGSVGWSGGGTSVSVSGDTRRITSRGVPSHTTGTYPVARSDDAYKYDRNPNRIRRQNVSLSLPATPEVAGSATCVPMGMIGVALTGAAIFNALDGPGRDAVAHEIQDACNGHPERTGEYHYHGPSDCMTEKGAGPNGHSGLVGYALDGFGIYGSDGAGGKHVHNSDLDACHGHVETVMWDGKPVSMYHYHLTDEYPYTIGCFRGEPVSTGSTQSSLGQRQQGGQGNGVFGQRPQRNANLSGQRQQRGGGLFGQRQQGGQGGPDGVIEAAAADLGVSADALRRAVGRPPPDFDRASRILGIPADTIRAAMERARSASN